MNIIALFMPADTPFYRGLYCSISNALEQHGLHVVGGYGFLENDHLESFIYQYKPTVFFEMNRCKNEIKNFPSSIIHICWLVDLAGRSLKKIGGSELICFFATEWMMDYTPNEMTTTIWLPPASDPKNYYPNKSKKLFTAVFAGHIPKPWTLDLLERPVGKCKEKICTFEDIVQNFENQWGQQDSIVNNDRYIQQVTDWLDGLGMETIIEDEVLRYDIGCRIVRKSRREYFLDWLLANENIQPFKIYGNNNWNLWNKYRFYYQKELKTPQAMNYVFNRAKIIIHEGVGAHFRLFDAILSGTPVVIRKSQEDHKFGGIGTLLSENQEYIGIDTELDKGVLTSLLDDEENLKRIAYRGRSKVMTEHTWFHRLSIVVDYIKKEASFKVK